MLELGVNVCKGRTARSFLEGKEIAQEIGFPLVIRPSFTLGGTGGGFVEKKKISTKRLTTACTRRLYTRYWLSKV
jgi:carbamoyl-phosphate synthase large subunit